MVGEKVKALREAKSWSQAHLAEASRLNVRTIQRIESGEPCSPETMLSLAAALDVDVGELAEGDRAAQWRPSPRRTWLAGLFAAPAAVFVAANLLRSGVGWSAPYDLLAAAGSRLMDFETFNAVSPAIFLGGLAAALALTLASLVRVRIKVEHHVLRINGVELALRPMPAIIAMVALGSGMAILGYAAIEKLASVGL